MIPFKFQLQPGQPIYEQVVYAVYRALVKGELRPGDPFPSVRALSKEIGVTPNTIQKVVAQLTREGVLDVFPGRGTYISMNYKPDKGAKKEFIQQHLESFVVEAKKHGVELSELVEAISKEWKK